MEIVENLQSRLGIREKPLHQTGEVSEDDFLQHLTLADYANLKIILQHSQSIASAIGVFIKPYPFVKTNF